MTEYEKMVVSFLKRENALIPYIKERRKYMIEHELCGLIEFFVRPDAAFSWISTAEGYEFWSLLGQKFSKALRKRALTI